MTDSSYQSQLDLLAEAFADRCRNGERPSIEEYVQQHPELADEIRETFPALMMLHQAEDDLREMAKPALADLPHPQLQELGDFRIIREVGRGGMGIVYEAEQVSLGRRVALKVLPKQTLLDSNSKQRFVREAKAAARLHHTNIVPVFGVGEHDGLNYYVMQYIHGLGLDQVLLEIKHLPEHQFSSAEKGSVDVPPQSPERSGRFKARVKVSAASMAQSLLSGEFAPQSALDSDFGLGSGENRPERRPESLATTCVLGETPAPANGRVSADSKAQNDTDVARLSDTQRGSVPFVLPGQSESGAQTCSRKVYWMSIARMGVQAAEALQYAHDQGIIHRDIKPSNLLLDIAGTLWITDFGLAKTQDQKDLTKSGDILGTLRYMAPEQFEGRTENRSDIYSLGLTLYEMLAKRPAFGERDRNRLIKQVTTQTPERLRTVDSSIPQDLATIIQKAIDPDPSHRYFSAKEMGEDLERFLQDEPIKARRISPMARFRRWCKRNPLVAGLTTTIMLLLLAASIISGFAANRFRDLAEEKSDALAQSVQDKQTAEASESKARSAQALAETQSQELAETVELAIQALEEVYLQYADEQLAVKTTLDESDQQFLRKALPFYESFTQRHEDTPGARSSLAKAADRVGTIQMRLNQFELAEESFRRSVELSEQLAKENPSGEGTQKDVASAKLNLAIALARSGKQQEAEALLKSCIDVYQKLSDQFPDKLSHRRQLAIGCYELGSLIQTPGDKKKAKSLYDRAIKELNGLVKKDPESLADRQSLAHALGLLANLKRTETKNAVAETSFSDFIDPDPYESTFNDSIRQYESIAAEAPENDEVVLSLAAGRRTFAEFLREKGRNDEAIKAYQAEIAERRKLVELAPHDPERKYELADTIHKLRDVSTSLGLHSEAKKQGIEAVDIMESVVQWWPNNRKYQWRRAIYHKRLGQTCESLDEIALARTHLLKAEEVVRQWVSHTDKNYRMNAQVDYQLGRIAVREENWEEAERRFREAAGKHHLLANKNYDTAWWKSRPAVTQLALADVLIKQGRQEEALAAYRTAIKYSKEFTPESSEQNAIQWKVAGLLASLDRHPEAKELANKCLDSLPNASVDYKVRITNPSVYRLQILGSFLNGSDDSAYVRILELADGPGGKIADWYYVGEEANEWHKDVPNDPWITKVYRFEGELFGKTPLQPAIWDIPKAGVYTIRVFMQEGGFAFDRVVLHQMSTSLGTVDPEESKRTPDGVFLEENGLAVAEAEYFSTRRDGPEETSWRVIPDENAGLGREQPNVSNGKYIQVLPTKPVAKLAMEAPDTDEFRLQHFESLDRAVQLRPNLPDLIAPHAKLAEQLEKYEVAAADYARLIELQPEQSIWRHRRAVALWKMGHYNQANEDLQTLANMFDDASNPLDRINIREFVDKPSDAKPEHYEVLIQLAKESLQHDPRSGELWRTLGSAYYRAKRYRDAAIAWRMMLVSAQPYPGMLAQYAMVLAKLENRETAFQTLQFSLAFGNLNNSPEGESMQDEAAEALGAPLESIASIPIDDREELLQRQLEFDPDFAGIYALKASQYEKEGQPEQAKAMHKKGIQAWTNLLSEIPEDWDLAVASICYRRAHLCYEMDDRQAQQLKQARDDLTRVIELTPRFVNGWNLRGIMRDRLGEHEQAIADYSKAIELSPNHSVFRHNRAYSKHVYLKRYRDAVPDWEKAVELAPTNADLREGLAYALYFSKKYEQAAEQFSWLLEKEPKNTQCLTKRLECYFEINRWQDALADATQWAKLEPKSIVPLDYRMRIFEKQGRLDLAYREYAKRLKVDPDPVFINQLDEELARNTRYLQQFPNDSYAWEQRGHLYSFRQEQDWCEFAFTKAIQLSPDVASHWAARSWYFLQRDHLSKAESDLFESLQRDKAQTHQLTQVVTAFARRDDLDAMRRVLSKAIDLGVKEYGFFYNLALLQAAAGDLNGYRNTCRLMLEQHRATMDREAIKFVIWTCSLAPEAFAEEQSLQTLARQLDQDAPDNRPDLYLGALAFRSGEYLKAIDDLTQHVNAAKNWTAEERNANSLTYGEYWLAMAFARLGLSKQASQHFSRATEAATKELKGSEASESQSVPWNRRLTLKLLEAEANAVLNEDIAPSAPNVLRDRALWYARQNNASNSTPKSSQEWFELAKVLCKQKLWKEAEFALTEAIDSTETPLQHYYCFRSWARRELGLVDAAIRDGEMAVGTSPNNPWGYWDLGASYHAKGEWEAAITTVTKFLSFKPELLAQHQARAYRTRAECYAHLGQSDEALQDLKSANALEDNAGSIYFRLGNVLRAAKNWEKAIDAYTKGIEENEDAALYHNRASVWYELRKYDNAILDANKAIALNERQPNGYYFLGKVLNAKEHWEDAAVALTKAIERHQGRSHYYRERGKAYFGRKQYDKAIADLETAMNLGSPDHEVRKLLEKARAAKVEK